LRQRVDYGRQGPYASQYCSNSAAAISTADEDSLVTAYPNPAADKITVDYGGSARNYQLKLYNAYDQLVVERAGTKRACTMAVAKLPEGLYYLHVITDKGIVSRKRIVIKR
jgi:hypothetical protein